MQTVRSAHRAEGLCPVRHSDDDGNPFGTDLSDDIYALREIEASLSPRLKAVYHAMLQLAGGGAGRTTYTELARIWGVSYPQIIKDRQKIEKMIRKNIKAKYQK